MATPYPGEETFHATITTIDGTDEQTAESVSVPLRELADRTKWLEANGGGGGGGLTKFAEGEATEAPNDVVPVVSLTALGSTVHVDAALVPKGDGALLAAIPDGTNAGGNKRGAQAVDLQTDRDDPAHVASGDFSVLGGGKQNTASGEGATVPGGESNTASNMRATVGGGVMNTADGVASCVPGGYAAHTRGVLGKLAYASAGTFDDETPGQAQTGILVLRGETTDATPRVLTSDGDVAGAENVNVLPDNAAYRIRVEVIGMDLATGDTFAGGFVGAVKRGAGAATIALVGGGVSAETPRKDAGADGWSVAVNTNTTVGSVGVSVTGEAGKTIRWVATMYTTEVTA